MLEETRRMREMEEEEEVEEVEVVRRRRRTDEGRLSSTGSSGDGWSVTPPNETSYTGGD